MVVSSKPPANAFVAAMRKVYNPIGFSKGYNFTLWFIFCGALLGFNLARFPYLNFDRYFCNLGKATPVMGQSDVDCYHLTERLGKVGILLHLGSVLPAGVMVVFQFVPAIRHKAMIVHRVNGYMILLLSLVSTVGVLMIARQSFGGGPLTMQVAIGLASIIFLGSQWIAYYNIKKLQIEQHRAWMIRSWGNGSFIITMRIIGLIMSVIVGGNGPSNYYLALPCAVIDYTYRNQTFVEGLYPPCARYYSGANPEEQVPVRADMTSDNPVEINSTILLSFASSGWLALFIHLIAVELYLRLTPVEAERLRRVSYQRQLEAGMKNPGNAGLTAQRIGDAVPWEPPTQKESTDHSAERLSDSSEDKE